MVNINEYVYLFYINIEIINKVPLILLIHVFAKVTGKGCGRQKVDQNGIFFI